MMKLAWYVTTVQLKTLSDHKKYGKIHLEIKCKIDGKNPVLTMATQLTEISLKFCHRLIENNDHPSSNPAAGPEYL